MLVAWKPFREYLEYCHRDIVVVMNERLDEVTTRVNVVGWIGVENCSHETA